MKKQTKPILHPNAGKSKWIIPPGLRRCISDFLKLYQSLHKNQNKKTPLMIMGDPGVGKSLFVHIFSKLFEEDNPKITIRRINIASYSEDLVRSELFGHVKGAFTGAIANKSGIVEDADLLILEEVGEISPAIQAQLLTFLEDGIYFSVGDTREKHAKKSLQIIATTNRKEDDFRPDFYSRFYKFNIPALYKRRPDLFIYLSHSSPEAMNGLRSWECLSLLAHHWPGNVRDVERIGEEILWRRLCYETDDFLSNLPVLPMALYDTQTSFKWYEVHDFVNSLNWNQGDIDALERELNEYLLGVSGKNDNVIFKAEADRFFTCSEESLAFDKKFGTITVLGNESYRKFSKGLFIFGATFGIHPDLNKNLFVIAREASQQNAEQDQIMPNLACTTFKKLEKEYFSQVLTKANQKIKEAAEIAGFKESAFRKRLKKNQLLE
ncbi:MAG: Anaerobic nitric oxide reductase transcription regulator NorR [Syntrophus sp. SKADARSKE-3]|nr:Anaerobic nitric oxide reductase transcription regulator NorR [Syntrophus sp. SKADARSKE-3]